MRYLIMLVAILLSSCTMPQSAISSSAPTAASQISHAAQLYTVRHELQLDFAGTLQKVAALGYQEIELAGLFDQDPASVRSMTDALELQILGSHINWKRLRDDPDGLIEETRILGAEYMILAWLPAEERQTLAQWEAWIEIMNDLLAGPIARASVLPITTMNSSLNRSMASNLMTCCSLALIAAM